MTRDEMYWEELGLEGEFPLNHCPCCLFYCGPAPRLEPLPGIYVDPGFAVYPSGQAEAMERNRMRQEADPARPHGTLSECPHCRTAFYRD